jgi:hypothetical protein
VSRAVRFGIAGRKANNPDNSTPTGESLGQMPFGPADVRIRGGIGVEAQVHGPALPGDFCETVNKFPLSKRPASIILGPPFLPSVDAY